MAGRKKTEGGSAANGRDESRADKFKRLGNRRLGRAVKGIKALAPLANKRVYDSTPEQAEKICTVLQEAVNYVAAAYEGKPEVAEMLDM